ncbi:methyltransferase domain-containing protein [Prevotella copri]|uniref:Methyltransferase domain-containing protein n=1 Tax=Segatella copri TaxID=165179 RepID=A0AA90VI71_9BACT|nr:methyltransferase domain-containing protein [Segatella copri]MQO10352.1 methyltransferase domain-containing protein [Segatella copri]
MNTEILSADKDPMGAAILDFQKQGKAARLRVLSSMFEEDEMPVTHLFRSVPEMPVLEQKALQLTKGRVLDIGAGSGCHTLELQKKGLAVKAIDISPLSCEAMKLRGVKDAECINLFDPHLSSGNHSGENQENHSGENQENHSGENQENHFGKNQKQFEGGFDTILLLMNGTGIAGKIEHLPALFHRLKALLNPGGQILIDSSDLKYIYENEDGSFDINLNGAYYGEVDYQMIYKDVKGDRFDWLYVDFPLLKSIAETCGLHGELVEEGEHYDYLARIFQA